MAAAFGAKREWGRGPHSISPLAPCRPNHPQEPWKQGRMPVSKDQVEILLVEDDANDVRLTLHALEEAHICNNLQVVRDGEEALDFLFCRGAFQNRDRHCYPKLVLLDLKLPKVNGFEVLREIRASP